MNDIRLTNMRLYSMMQLNVSPVKVAATTSTRAAEGTMLDVNAKVVYRPV
jgi:hypothetical protein